MKTKVLSRFVICSALLGLGCGISGRLIAQEVPSVSGTEQPAKNEEKKAESGAQNEEKKVGNEGKQEEKKAEKGLKKDEKKTKKNLHHKGKKEKNAWKKAEKDMGL
ncbi:MAG: hypothetical protein PHO89_07780 [Methylacidiphilaceae bacterium]|nr:hypothetical protein [Candidatus Methylacidiphilaceae bacterium]